MGSHMSLMGSDGRIVSCVAVACGLMLRGDGMMVLALAAVLWGAAAVCLSEGRRRCGTSVGIAGGERGEIAWLKTIFHRMHSSYQKSLFGNVIQQKLASQNESQTSATAPPEWRGSRQQRCG